MGDTDVNVVEPLEPLNDVFNADVVDGRIEEKVDVGRLGEELPCACKFFQ